MVLTGQNLLKDNLGFTKVNLGLLLMDYLGLNLGFPLNNP